MIIKNIIFDFGGVLMDWNPKYLYQNVFNSEEEMDYFLDNIATLKWNAEQDRGRSFQEATEILQNQYPEFSKEIALYYSQWPVMLKGTIEENVSILRNLHGRYQLYGLTNWSAESFPYAYKNYDFFSLFNGIVVSGEEKLIKPDERIYELLLNRYNLNASECLFIDDNYENIRTAQAMDFNTIHLPPHTNLKEELQKFHI
ncbi:HAD family phosphatase [Elizabethkingia anophelis]|uniref:?-D-glucose-1-phosphatase n=3 Tax=Elizabethkingia anophelis TaxID=1117645 RepID=A0A1T3E2L6_9FLAO|nr:MULTISPECIES: HAD family phosphatase [Elizabethkingia]AIL44870.1 HAD superfamily hydrolase [Elizabethkingia anophelis NUHP1]AQW89645.1 HAD family hydrolase [Elizabethkingia anophelis]AQW98618.1 HAD family hydrolase [Elizabethkingia anophelis]AQX50863.1 HAD family hydrolase [Elizabethkingia anophelis]AQX89164.1 HAD family hydrolase [Elizabethkingia anophelis]